MRQSRPAPRGPAANLVMPDRRLQYPRQYIDLLRVAGALCRP
ncbi:hypothetical protein [Streptomyces sp. NPDC088730]